MQLKAALPPSQSLRCGAAVSRRALSRSVGLASFGARRTRSVLSRATSTVGVGCPSFGGQRTASGGLRSGVLGAAEVLQSSRCWSRSAWAARPAAASARLWSAQAPRSAARCPRSQALSARRGCGGVERVALSLASCNGGCLGSFGASKLTVVNASQFIGCGSANAAPNHSVKRTAPGVPGSAAYLKRSASQRSAEHVSQQPAATRRCLYFAADQE